MVNLSIPELPEDEKFLQRSAKTLLRNFKPTSGKQINNAVLLSVQLVARGFIRPAMDFLESFVNDLKPIEGDTNIWGSAGRGIVLLAYLYHKEGNAQRERELVERVMANDIMSDRSSRAEYLAEDLAEYRDTMNYAQSEPQKYQCEIIADQILNFTYYYEMWSKLAAEVHPSEKSIVERIIQDSYSALREAIGKPSG